MGADWRQAGDGRKYWFVRLLSILIAIIICQDQYRQFGKECSLKYKFTLDKLCRDLLAIGLLSIFGCRIVFTHRQVIRASCSIRTLHCSFWMSRALMWVVEILFYSLFLAVLSYSYISVLGKLILCSQTLTLLFNILTFTSIIFLSKVNERDPQATHSGVRRSPQEGKRSRTGGRRPGRFWMFSKRRS